LSVGADAVRQILERYPSVTGGVMQYALLAYGSQRTYAGPVEGAIADVLARPYVTGWARLHADGSATTVRNGEGRTLLTDGPFVETKEHLLGFYLLDVPDLDTAVEWASRMPIVRHGTVEVRPLVRGAEWRKALE
jgi:hypothetical protein